MGPSALAGCSPQLQTAAPADSSDLDKYYCFALCHDVKTVERFCPGRSGAPAEGKKHGLGSDAQLHRCHGSFPTLHVFFKNT